MQLVRIIAAWLPDATYYRDSTTATSLALRSLAHRCFELTDEIANLNVPIKSFVEDLSPELLTRTDIGIESAAQLFVTVGDNSERLRSEASFAAQCGVSPVPTSYGKPVRHRLNRGRDRAANSALHVIVISRWRLDETTTVYVAKRTAEGMSKLEIIRCLERYVACEV